MKRLTVDDRGPDNIADRASEDDLRVAFEQHYAPLVRFCLLMTGSREVAEDLAQDAFVRVAGRSGDWTIDNMGAYLRKVVLNLWKNRIRRALLERRVSRQQAFSPGSGTEAGATQDILWQAIQRLPDRQKACLVLRYYEDMSVRDVASVLGVSEGAIKSNTSKAITRLREEVHHGV
jgi:RNA polymerase sigma-70 factor (sigma-E family)